MNRKLCCMICAGVLMLAGATCIAQQNNSALAAEAGLSVKAHSAYAIEHTTGEVVYAHNEAERRPIASMVKIMTLLLSMEAIERGEMSVEDDVTVSEYAASMGGSQAFLDAGSVHKVGPLLKSIVVASANDSCVAIAEHLSGGVESFVAKMNERAEQLGMHDTLFTNCTGLPGTAHYSCARDVAVMSRELMKYPLFYEYSQEWMYDFVHPSGRVTGLTNTNRLIRNFPGCDGGKTGFTNEAGFCVSATAQRGNMRLISVVMGGADSKSRFADAGNVLNYGFANFRNIDAVTEGQEITMLPVHGGREKEVAVVAKSRACVFGRTGEAAEITTKVDCGRVSAPVKQGEVVGKIFVLKDGVVVGESELVAASTVERKTFWDCVREIAQGF